jgi:hypothetical protein
MGLFNFFKKKEEYPKLDEENDFSSLDLDLKNPESPPVLDEEPQENYFSIPSEEPELPEESNISTHMEDSDLSLNELSDEELEQLEHSVEELPEINKQLPEETNILEQEEDADNLLSGLPSFEEEIQSEYMEAPKYGSDFLRKETKDSFFVSKKTYSDMISNLKNIQNTLQSQNTDVTKYSTILTRSSKAMSKGVTDLENLQNKFMEIESKLSR